MELGGRRESRAGFRGRSLGWKGGVGERGLVVELFYPVIF